MKLILGVLVVAVAVLGGGLVLVYSGLADVAATTPHWAATEWVLSTAMERAVRRRARGIEPPPFLEDEARVRAGAVAYDDMCAACHGRPGEEAGVIARGLNPEPPELAEEAEEWSPGELFWITRHGVRMTGMPAFGPTHGDDELWEVVALVKRLPRLSPEQYRELVGSRSGAEPAPSHAESPEPEPGQVPSPHGAHGHPHAHGPGPR
jgi:mono/diheme cytochrome c family protein